MPGDSEQTVLLSEAEVTLFPATYSLIPNSVLYPIKLRRGSCLDCLDLSLRFIRNQRGERLLLPTSHFASDFSVTMDARILRLKGKAYQKRRSLHPK